MDTRKALVLLAAATLAGCAKLDADLMVGQGVVRVEPVAGEPGVSRVSILAVTGSPLSVSDVDPNRPEGRERLLATIFPAGCSWAEDGRVSLAPNLMGYRREQITFRVRCP